MQRGLIIVLGSCVVRYSMNSIYGLCVSALIIDIILRSNLPPLKLESQKRDTNRLSQYWNDFLKCDFCKCLVQSYGVICAKISLTTYRDNFNYNNVTEFSKIGRKKRHRIII